MVWRLNLFRGMHSLRALGGVSEFLFGLNSPLRQLMYHEPPPRLSVTESGLLLRHPSFKITGGSWFVWTTGSSRGRFAVIVILVSGVRPEFSCFWSRRSSILLLGVCDAGGLNFHLSVFRALCLAGLL